MEILLFTLFVIKHFLLDFPLQTQFHLKKGLAKNWLIPLLCHCTLHAIGTFIIIAFIDIQLAIVLSICEVFIHSTIDRIKASPYMLGRFTPDNKYFWWSFGLDQMLHYLTYVIFIYIITTRNTL